MTKKRWIGALVLVAFIAIVALALHGRSSSVKSSASSGRQNPAGNAAVPVVATRVAQQDMPIYREGLGSAVAFNTVTVRSRVDGQLMKVAFTEGQEVHQGDLLAEIDPRPFQIALQQARAMLARDHAQLALARLNLSRNLELRNEKLIAQQDLDQQAATVAQLEAVVQADQSQINSAQLQLQYARITSPLNGRTGIRLVDAGNIIHANDPNGLVVITQLDPIAILATLPEDDLPAISEQMSQHSLEAEAFSRDGKVNLGTGRVALVDNQINPGAGTIKLKTIFSNPKGNFWPNQFVKVRIRLTTRKDALIVPASVVQRGPAGSFAYVIKPDQTVEPRPIQVGLTQGDTALIEKGLQAGEQVVTEGQFKLRPGIKVVTQVKEPASPRAEVESQSSPRNRP
jgi:multidrug efflux system membrane fusion protein